MHHSLAFVVYLIVPLMCSLSCGDGTARAASKSPYIVPMKGSVAAAMSRFETDCGLKAVAQFHDQPIENYFGNAFHHAWRTNSSPHPILTRLVSVPPGSTPTSMRHRILATAINTANSTGDLDLLRVTFNLSARGLLKAQRTCADRLATQTTVGVGLFFKAYGNVQLNYNARDAITLLAGTWRTNIRDLLNKQDRRLASWLYDFYRSNGRGGQRWVVIERLTGSSILRTNQSRSSAALRASLEAGGTLGIVSAETTTTGSTSYDEKIDFSQSDTLIQADDQWDLLNGQSVPLPSIDLAELPSPTEVEKTLKTVKFTHPAWIGPAAITTPLDMYLAGTTSDECNSIELFRCDSSGQVLVLRHLRRIQCAHGEQV
jgi:hypothetical protein